MLQVAIRKVENPSCIWGQVGSGPGDDAQTGQYDNLMNQMNLYYRNITRNPQLLKPASLEKGQMCVVFWSVNKSWCRAVITLVMNDPVMCECFLVDHGESLVVTSDQIRVLVENFLQLPFKVKKFHLSGIKPTTLWVSVHEEKAKLIPSSQWDSSAILYIHRLVKASTQTEVVLGASEAESTAIYLYVTVDNIKICVNDDLVAKKFAYYCRESADSSVLDEEDQCPAMLSTSILHQSVFVTPNKPVTQRQPPPVMSHTLDEAGACNWQTTACVTQNQQHEVMICTGGSRPKVTEQIFLGSQLNSSLDAGVAESFLKFLNPGSSPQQTAPGRDEDTDQSEETTPTLKTCTAQEVEPGIQEEPTLHSMSRTAKSAPEEFGPAEKKETHSSTENWACTRFLEWLNPEPLNPDPDSTADTIIPTRDPENTGILVHSALPIEPCSGLDDAPITDSLRWVKKI